MENESDRRGHDPEVLTDLTKVLQSELAGPRSKEFLLCLVEHVPWLAKHLVQKQREGAGRQVLALQGVPLNAGEAHRGLEVCQAVHQALNMQSTPAQDYESQCAVAVLTVAAAAAASKNGSVPSPILRLVSSYRSNMEELHPLGKGGFGTVVAAVSRMDQRRLAIKRVAFKSEIPPWAPAHMLEEHHGKLLREVRALACLDGCHHVVRYYSAWLEPDWDKVARLVTQCPGASHYQGHGPGTQQGLPAMLQLFTPCKKPPPPTPVGNWASPRERTAVIDKASELSRQIDETGWSQSTAGVPMEETTASLTSDVKGLWEQEIDGGKDLGLANHHPGSTASGFSSRLSGDAVGAPLRRELPLKQQSVPLIGLRHRRRVVYIDRDPIVVLPSSSEEDSLVLPPAAAPCTIVELSDSGSPVQGRWSQSNMVPGIGFDSALDSSDAEEDEEGWRVDYDEHREVEEDDLREIQERHEDHVPQGAEDRVALREEEGDLVPEDSSGPHTGRGPVDAFCPDGTQDAQGFNKMHDDVVSSDGCHSNGSFWNPLVTRAGCGLHDCREDIARGDESEDSGGLICQDRDQGVREDEWDDPYGQDSSDANKGRSLPFSDGDTWSSRPHSTSGSVDTCQQGGAPEMMGCPDGLKPQSNTIGDMSWSNLEAPMKEGGSTVIGFGGNVEIGTEAGSESAAKHTGVGGTLSSGLTSQLTGGETTSILPQRPVAFSGQVPHNESYEEGPSSKVTSMVSSSSTDDSQTSSTVSSTGRSLSDSSSPCGEPTRVLCQELVPYCALRKKPKSGRRPPEHRKYRSNRNRAGYEDMSGDNDLVVHRHQVCSRHVDVGNPSVRIPKRWPYVLYISMELMPGDNLEEWLARRNRGGSIMTSHSVELEIFWQVVCGVVEIHDRGLMHRDLKPSNIFVNQGVDHGGNEAVQVKIGDFGLAIPSARDLHPVMGGLGLSRVPSDPGGSSTTSHTSGVGTASYCAPEQMSGEGLYNYAVDMFPLGLILMELFCSFSTGMERASAFWQARQGVLPSSFHTDYPNVALLAQSLLSSDPLQRPTAQQVLGQVGQWKMEESTARESPPIKMTLDRRYGRSSQCSSSGMREGDVNARIREVQQSGKLKTSSAMLGGTDEPMHCSVDATVLHTVQALSGNMECTNRSQDLEDELGTDVSVLRENCKSVGAPPLSLDIPSVSAMVPGGTSCPGSVPSIHHCGENVGQMSGQQTEVGSASSLMYKGVLRTPQQLLQLLLQRDEEIFDLQRRLEEAGALV